MALDKKNYVGKNSFDKEKIKKENLYDKYIIEIKNLKNMGFKIIDEEFYLNKSHKERYINTEKFKIYIPGGLDCISPDGLPKLDGDDDTKEIRIDFR